MSPAHPPDPRAAFVAAVVANDVGLARELLDRHAELRAQLNHPAPELPFGMLPILPVVKSGHREMVEVFLGAGADINARSDWWAGGFGVLDSCDPALAPFLVERGAIVDAHAASRLGLLDRLRAIVSADPGSVHARGGDGQTPLHFASSVEIAQFLLDHGADIDALDVDHESTPAQWMVRDRQEVARHLIERGGRTDLLMAVALGDQERVRRMLDVDPASIRTRVAERYFPKRDPRAGGTIYHWTLGTHKSAHAIAREFGHPEIVSLLMTRSPAPLRLAAAFELGDQALARSLLASDPDLVRSLAEEDRPQLADAALGNRTDAVRLMLAAGRRARPTWGNAPPLGGVARQRRDGARDPAPRSTAGVEGPRIRRVTARLGHPRVEARLAPGDGRLSGDGGGAAGCGRFVTGARGRPRRERGRAGGTEATAYPPPAGVLRPLPVLSCSITSSSTLLGGRTRSSGKVASGTSTRSSSSSNGLRPGSA